MIEEGRFSGTGTPGDKNMFLGSFNRGKHCRLFGRELPRMELRMVFDSPNLPLTSVAVASSLSGNGLSPQDAFNNRTRYLTNSCSHNHNSDRLPGSRWPANR
jgi:hypothetical protein